MKGGPADGLEPLTSVPRGPGERLMAVIGKQMEPNRLSIRLFGNVVRSRHGDNAEVTEVQVQV